MNDIVRTDNHRGGRRSRDRGSRGERQFVNLLQENGIAAERISLSGSAGGKFAGDVLIPLLGVDRIAEVKTRASGFRQLYAWLAGRDLLALKADRADWLIVLHFKTFIEITAATALAKQHSGFADFRDPLRAPSGADALDKTRRQMMRKESKMTNTNLPAPIKDVIARLLQVAQETSGLGRLLKFNKGKYFTGDDEVSIGREKIAHVLSLARGWVKFVDGKVVQQEIGKVAEGYKQAVRNELGDLDESKWERDARGNPRDPWSEQMYLPMEDAETGEIAVFVTGSHGGKGAIRALLNVAGRNLDKGAPVIRLAVSSYRHRTFGRIETPDFPVVSWTGSSGVVEKPAVAEELNDEIPYTL
jgi:hypothetical protein